MASVLNICIGADHAGYALKEHLKDVMAAWNLSVTDVGTYHTEITDYPPYCEAVARHVAAGNADRGIVLGGSGQGEQMVANKVRGIRAALCNDVYTAALSRQHNDANVLAMGGRIVGLGLAEEILRTWLSTNFEGAQHVQRIKMIGEIEQRAAH